MNLVNLLKEKAKLKKDWKLANSEGKKKSGIRRVINLKCLYCKNLFKYNSFDGRVQKFCTMYHYQLWRKSRPTFYKSLCEREDTFKLSLERQHV